VTTILRGQSRGTIFTIARDGDYSFVAVDRDNYFKYGCDETKAPDLAWTYAARLANLNLDAPPVAAVHAPGAYNPRIWRGAKMSPRPEDVGLRDEWLDAVRASRLLTSRLREIFRFVEPAQGNKAAFGHELRALLLLACTEFEQICKAVLRANGTDGSATADYVKLRPAMRLDEWEVALTSSTSYGSIRPFAGWQLPNASQTIRWYAAYNATKHDRGSAFHEACLENVISAVAAVYVMMVAQFGPENLDLPGVFPLDEFVVTAEPAWPAHEMYIPQQIVPWA